MEIERGGTYNPGHRPRDALRLFEGVRGDDGEGPNPKKKHLLHLLVKKVLIHDRRTVEIWYGLSNRTLVRTPGHLAPWAGLGYFGRNILFLPA
jgi:hypothetical protein